MRPDTEEKKDVFRQEYKPLTDEQIGQMNAIKVRAQELLELIIADTNDKNGREMAVAKTQLETAIMWAVKGITA